MLPGKYLNLDKGTLAGTNFYKLMSLGLISYMTPFLTTSMRGIVGLFMFIFLALIVGSLEKCFPIITENIRIGISKNKFFFFLAAWYAIGVVINIMLRGGGFNDWRLLVSPVLLLAGFLITFGLYHDEKCYHSFQIWLLLVSGVQAIYSYQKISGDLDIAREMFIESQGGWSYGNQGSFAVFAIILPIFVWRALSESGVLRWGLVTASIAVFMSIMVSTLAAPLSLIFIGTIFIAIVLFFVPFSRTNRGIAVLISVLLVTSSLSAYTIGRDIPVLAPVYYRVANLLDDPTSGGYSGNDLDESRFKKADVSIANFLEAPLFGMGGGSTRTSGSGGGHSSLFDSLGVYGLLGGGGALVALMTILLKNSFKRFLRERDWESLAGLTSVVLLVIAGIVNPYWEGFQPVIVFLLARPLLDRRE